jgi:hypothetical protein
VDSIRPLSNGISALIGLVAPLLRQRIKKSVVVGSRRRKASDT